jgi:hypothetical protein
LDARLTTLLCKKNIIAKSKEVKTEWTNSQEWTNLVNSSKEGYGSNRAILLVMMMIMKCAISGQ